MGSSSCHFLRVWDKETQLGSNKQKSNASREDKKYTPQTKKTHVPVGNSDSVNLSDNKITVLFINDQALLQSRITSFQWNYHMNFDGTSSVDMCKQRLTGSHLTCLISDDLTKNITDLVFTLHANCFVLIV